MYAKAGENGAWEDDLTKGHDVNAKMVQIGGGWIQ